MMRWTGHVGCTAETLNYLKIIVGKSKEERLLQRLEDYVKMNRGKLHL
jgi:hypothetical protein